MTLDWKHLHVYRMVSKGKRVFSPEYDEAKRELRDLGIIACVERRWYVRPNAASKILSLIDSKKRWQWGI